MKTVRTHDKIYLFESRHDKPKEYFKFIEKKAFGKKRYFNKKEIICDFGCATGEFISFLKKKHPEKNFVGADVRSDLLKRAKKIVPDLTFLKKSVLNTKAFPKNKFDKCFLLGVHPIFDDFEKCFSNLVLWAKPKGKIFIYDLFNPYPVDVLIKFRFSKDYKKGPYKKNWNIFSQESVSRFLKKNKSIKNFQFEEFEMPFDLKPKKDPARSWTIKSNKKRLTTNGLSIIQRQILLSIYLK